MIELINVTKKYNGEEVLKDISIKITNGIYAFTGPSGSGKTTLLNIIGHIDNPTTGNRYLDGTLTTDITESRAVVLRRKYFSYVFQKSNLIEDFSVIENIKLPVFGNNPVPHEVLHKLGLSKYIYRKPHELSAGEKQRVAFLRAITKNPRFIILDEPTANLDEYTTNLILGILKNLKNTVILATHNMELAENADFIYKIKNGRIEEVKCMSGLMEKS